MGCYDNKRVIRNIVIIGFVSSVIFHCIMGMHLGRGYPYSTFLFKPVDRFSDFFDIYWATMNLDPFAKGVSVYFPFAYIPVYLLTFLIPSVAHGIFVGVFLLFLLVAEHRFIPSTGIGDRLFTMGVFTALTYPVLILLDRGNLEGLVFIFIGMFVYCYKQEKDAAAALFLSCAIAMKLYPAVFCVLFVADRRWKPLLLVAVSTLVLTVSSAALLKGGISGSIAGLQANMILFKSTYLNRLPGFQHNSSLYVPAFLIALKMSFNETLSKVYPYFAILLFLASAACIEFRVKEYWKRIAILSCMMILLPQVSFDYKLVHIFLPLLLFLGSELRSRFDGVYSIIFGLLLIPKDYYYLVRDVSINGILNAILITVFIVLTIVDRSAESPA